jgi:hypothetical protein
VGTPNYRPDLAKEFRDLRRGAAAAFTATAGVKKEGRPWSAMTVSDTDSARWPSTTSDSFTDAQAASGTRSHPTVAYTVLVSAPAAGSELRVVDEASNVLLSPVSISSGTNTLTGTFPVPAGLDYYEEFTVYFQIRSVASGQSTRATVASVYGRA